MAGMIARFCDILRPQGREPLAHRRPPAAKSSSECRQDISGNNKSRIDARLFGGREVVGAAKFANNRSDRMRRARKYYCRTHGSIAPRWSRVRTRDTRDQN